MAYVGNTPNDAPVTVSYITQTPSSVLIAEQALSALGTGILKNTTGTGVLSIAVANTDYQAASANLTTIAGLTPSAGKFIGASGSVWTTLSGSTARTQLGLGSTDNVNFNDINFTGRILFSSVLFLHNTGFSNTFVGAGAGNSSVSGLGNNFGGGNNALHNITTATDTIALGSEAAKFLTTAARVIAIGRQALENATTGPSDTIAIGHQALLNNNNTFNTALGSQAGLTCDGSGNTLIGALTDAASGVNNSTAIGAGTSVSSSNCIVLGSAQKVGVGITPAYKFDVFGQINTNSVYSVSGSQVIGARMTGWSSATGSDNRASFDTSTVSHTTLAETVKSLLDDLMAHGLIGP